MQAVMNTFAHWVNVISAPSESKIAEVLQRVEYPRETVGYVAMLLKDMK
jgi:hypothetical protein